MPEDSHTKVLDEASAGMNCFNASPTHLVERMHRDSSREVVTPSMTQRAQGHFCHWDFLAILRPMSDFLFVVDVLDSVYFCFGAPALGRPLGSP